MRTPKILIRLAVLLITAAGVLFAGIIYEGNEYTETMMPYSYSGSNENFIVISGSIDNYNSSRLSIFEINGVNMNNSSELPAAEDGKKYFIHLKGQNKNASFSVSGINDWSVEQPLDTTAIILPFTKTGEGRYFFSANQQIASVSSSGMDTLLINESDYTNLSSTELPESVEGHYYIYYRATSASAQMKLQPFGIPPAPDIDTTEIAVPYTKTGAGKHYFSTTDNIGSLTSVNMDTLLINNRVFSNQTVTDLPEKEEGYYYIYYSASLSTAAMMIEFPAEPEPEVPEFIHYNGNDYTVKMMPYSYRGNTEYYIAVSGTISSYSSNALNIFEINGVNMNNASGLPDPEDGKKYFIHFKGARGNSTINIDGINDWSTLEDPAPIDTVTIDLPFTVNGAGEYYYSTTNALDSLSSSSVDELLVNRVDLSNQNTSNIPPAINGVYYIYYRSSLPSATASFYLPKPVEKDTLEVGIPYRASGSGKYYFSTGEDLYSVSSENMDTLLINDQDYTNLTITSLPPDINGKYYIYYSASQQTANMSLGAAPPDTVSIHLPFTKTGSGEQYYVTAEEIGEISSSGMLALDINGIDFKNRTSNDLPEKINGNYYIYYHAVNSDAAMTLQKTPENPEIINWNGNDYSFIEMPWSYIGSSVTRVYTYGKITSFNTNNFITSLEINGQSYTVNQTHTDPPASIDQKYFITITPKNHKGEFEIDGETKKFVYKLNIKVLLEGAL